MKRIASIIISACIALNLSAQESIKVNYQGDKPTISDLAGALLNYLASDDEDEAECDESARAIRHAWLRQNQGLPMEEGVTLTVDLKNGFVLYESRYEEHLLRIEMCYWNEADKKHKLLAFNVMSFSNGEYSPGQFDGLVFYRYDNAAKEMVYTQDTGFEAVMGTDGAYITYSLPRSGKDITVTTWHKSGATKKTLKWTGRGFSY